VEDIFISKSRKVTRKWRLAEITQIIGSQVHLHYLGWDNIWDEVIDMSSADASRIKEAYTFTSPGDDALAYARHHSVDNSIIFQMQPSNIQDCVSMVSLYEMDNNDRRRSSYPGMHSDFTNDLLFRDKLKRLGLHVINVQSDGNCLFRAVAHQLYLDEERHDELRQRCVKHLSKHRSRFSLFISCDFDEYLQRTSTPGVWGDDLEIRALEELTDRLICIYSSESREVKPLKTDFDESPLLPSVSPILLSYHGCNHYNSVMNEKQELPLSHRNTKVILLARSLTR